MELADAKNVFALVSCLVSSDKDIVIGSGIDWWPFRYSTACTTVNRQGMINQLVALSRLADLCGSQVLGRSSWLFSGAIKFQS